MVVIRLSRAGTKKKPFYHLAVTDKRNPRDGRFIERVGFYDPIARGKSEPVRVDLSRVDYWLSVGAQLSPKVKSIVARARKIDAIPAEVPVADESDDSTGSEVDTNADVVAEESLSTSPADSDSDMEATETEDQEPPVESETGAEVQKLEEEAPEIVADTSTEAPNEEQSDVADSSEPSVDSDDTVEVPSDEQVEEQGPDATDDTQLDDSPADIKESDDNGKSS